jgi:hypothetical protein
MILSYPEVLFRFFFQLSCALAFPFDSKRSVLFSFQLLSRQIAKHFLQNINVPNVNDVCIFWQTFGGYSLPVPGFLYEILCLIGFIEVVTCFGNIYFDLIFVFFEQACFRQNQNSY